MTSSKSYTITQIKKLPSMKMEDASRWIHFWKIGEANSRNLLRHQLLEELKIKEKKDGTK